MPEPPKPTPFSQIIYSNPIPDSHIQSSEMWGFCWAFQTQKDLGKTPDQFLGDVTCALALPAPLTLPSPPTDLWVPWALFTPHNSGFLPEPYKATEPKTHLASPQRASLVAHPSWKGPAPAFPCLAQGGHPRAAAQSPHPSSALHWGRRFNSPAAQTPPAVLRGYLEPPARSFPTPCSAAEGMGEPCP